MRRQMNGPLRRLLQTSQVKYTSSVLAISALIVGGVTVTVFLANVAVVYDKEQRIAGLLKIRADLRTRLNSLEKKEPSPLTT